ncbi:perosamine synthetase [Lacrimispora brassicae]
MDKIPVTIPYFTDEEGKEVEKVLESGWVAQGPMVAKFEEIIAQHEGIKYGVAATSCTTALHLAMAAKGLKRGMDAIVPAFTFVATANAVIETGATPIFVDICQETFNVDIKQLERLIKLKYRAENGKLVNKKTNNILWGMVPVHEFGLCCDILKVNEIATRYNLNVVEDAACALGAKIGNKHQGAFGNLSCVSFHPRKSITTGEGGMVLTDDSSLAERMRELRTHGSTVSADARHQGKGFLLPEFNEAGYNYRMTDIQAAIGIAQSKKLDFIISEKISRAQFYNQLIREKLPELIVPYVPENYYHTYQSYVCMLDYKKLNLNTIEEGGEYRNILLQRLEDRGIATRQGTHAVHMLGYYKNTYGYAPEDYPNAYACDHLSITLPLYVQMSDEDQETVVDMIRDVLDSM